MKEAIDLFGANTQLSVSTPVDTLFAQHLKSKIAIEKIADYVSEHSEHMSYFFHGAMVKNGTGSYSAERFFDKENALAALDAEYWSRVMSLTDVLESMPATMRSEWHKQIQNCDTPSFEREAVLVTMDELLMKRAEFFIDRVEGIFRALSGEHVTNQPQGFGKRMILSRVLDAYGLLNYSYCEYIHDLRVVVARFMGTEAPSSYSTRKSISYLYDNELTGEWHAFDGGSWRAKVFKKGTVHLEVHPNMSWRLNQVLAHRYPMALPAESRTKPKVIKDHPIVTELITRETLQQLEDHNRLSDTSIRFNTQLNDRAKEILGYIGGESVGPRTWCFTYNAALTIHEIARTGQMPEKKSYQYFQTQEPLARHVVDLADISADDSILEPSAGMAGLAQFLPKDQTLCIELSRLHCTVLKSKGFRTVESDFIRWDTDEKFDKIVMNPPYSDGRAIEHLTKAHSLLKDTGKLVAILPASLKDKIFFEGWVHDWSDVLENQFKASGTSVRVSILTLSH